MKKCDVLAKLETVDELEQFTKELAIFTDELMTFVGKTTIKEFEEHRRQIVVKKKVEQVIQEEGSSKTEVIHLLGGSEEAVVTPKPKRKYKRKVKKEEVTKVEEPKETEEELMARLCKLAPVEVIGSEEEEKKEEKEEEDVTVLGDFIPLDLEIEEQEENKEKELNEYLKGTTPALDLGKEEPNILNQILGGSQKSEQGKKVTQNVSHETEWVNIQPTETITENVIEEKKGINGFRVPEIKTTDELIANSPWFRTIEERDERIGSNDLEELRCSELSVASILG